MSGGGFKPTVRFDRGSKAWVLEVERMDDVYRFGTEIEPTFAPPSHKGPMERTKRAIELYHELRERKVSLFIIKERIKPITKDWPQRGTWPLVLLDKVGGG